MGAQSDFFFFVCTVGFHYVGGIDDGWLLLSHHCVTGARAHLLPAARSPRFHHDAVLYSISGRHSTVVFEYHRIVPGPHLRRGQTASPVHRRKHSQSAERRGPGDNGTTAAAARGWKWLRLPEAHYRRGK